jgi:hypothetical protein
VRAINAGGCPLDYYRTYPIFRAGSPSFDVSSPLAFKTGPFREGLNSVEEFFFVCETHESIVWMGCSLVDALALSSNMLQAFSSNFSRLSKFDPQYKVIGVK